MASATSTSSRPHSSTVLESYASLFPGYALNVDDSAALGTDPSRTDADGDGLTDYFELYTGWIVLRHDGSVSARVLRPAHRR